MAAYKIKMENWTVETVTQCTEMSMHFSGQAGSKKGKTETANAILACLADRAKGAQKVIFSEPYQYQEHCYYSNTPATAHS
jgi:hypothetical protein